MRQEKTVAANDGRDNFNERSNYNQSEEKNQFIFNFGKQPARITFTFFDDQSAGVPTFRFTGVPLACDECALPLYLYGENYVESHTGGRAYLRKALCNSHAAEFLEVQK